MLDSKGIKNFSLNEAASNLDNLFPFQFFFLITENPCPISTFAYNFIIILKFFLRFLFQNTDPLFEINILSFIFLFNIIRISIFQDPSIVNIINLGLISTYSFIGSNLNVAVKISSY